MLSNPLVETPRIRIDHLRSWGIQVLPEQFLKRRHSPLYLALLAIFLLAFLLGCLGLNQSSVGNYAQSVTGNHLIAGPDRPIRSDEWLVRLPWLSSQVANGFPDQINTVGIHDAGVIYDLPSHSIDLLVRPHLIPYVLLGLEKGLATEWWLLLAGTVSVMALLLSTIRVNTGIALSLGLMTASSCGLLWWNVNSTFTIFIYFGLATYVGIRCLSSHHRWRHRVLSITCGWSFACGLVVLYPPFQIPILLTCAVFFASSQFDELRKQGIWGVFRRFLPALLTVGGLAIGFYARHHSALQTLTQTVYPGSRRENGGQVSISRLFGSVFDWFSSGTISASVNGTNQSENASTLPIYLVFLIFGAHAIVKKPEDTNNRVFRYLRVLVVLLLAWISVPIPSWAGRLVLFDKIPPGRLLPMLIFPTILLAGVWIVSRHIVRSVSAIISCSAVITLVLLTVGNSYRVNDLPLSMRAVWLWTTAFVLGVVSFVSISSSFRVVPLLILSMSLGVRVNPVHFGLEQLTHNKVVDEIRKWDPGRKWSWNTFTGDPRIRGTIAATGVKTLSFVSPFPDKKLWNSFALPAESAPVWNRYAHIFPRRSDGGPTVNLAQTDVVELGINPCDKSIQKKLELKFFIEGDPSNVPCGDVVDSFDEFGLNLVVIRLGQ